ncbi:MAG: lysine 2,3-aminomutase [Planctomycetota bacterium]
MNKRIYRAHTVKDIDAIAERGGLTKEQVTRIRAIAAVLPFRVNNYVLDELIRWHQVPDDPIYQLTFPQSGMLDDDDLQTMVELVRRGAESKELTSAARGIQARLNPHPAGQLDLNVPRGEDGEPLPGMQHKYRETVLFFPAQGQTCHAYCSYCFRWAQFVGVQDLKFASREAESLAQYVRAHPEVSDVLITGGDPMIMRTAKLRAILEPLLAPDLEHLKTIRIGSKALAWWPYRFTTDEDADDLMRLFEEVITSGKQLAFMAHYTHPRELEPDVAREALARVRSTGVIVRCQAPLVRHVNDDADAWAQMWRTQVRLGAVPYYMFVERDTGARNYFEVPLGRAHRIFANAYRQVSGLARTVRGPSMSATPGKVVVHGEATIRGERVFCLQFLQARDPSWVGQPFFARWDARATWLDQLQPAFDEPAFFFEGPRERRARQLAMGRSDQPPAIAASTDWPTSSILGRNA